MCVQYGCVAVLPLLRLVVRARMCAYLGVSLGVFVIYLYFLCLALCGLVCLCVFLYSCVVICAAAVMLPLCVSTTCAND